MIKNTIETNKEEFNSKEERRYCPNKSGKWETIGFFVLAIVVIISVNFGNR